ncbi:amidohydrolase family protein [Paradesulfitobacterium ferrireducens]|uniref:amidohydrolase family protein n=1 Tax=Paradesulfitobacterium ferrireducens TaxID=2816476 RepID=UPI001A8D93B5|nr:amidohydrolase family protein [Paradesulfitobacterium ferrireducens]
MKKVVLGGYTVVDSQTVLPGSGLYLSDDTIEMVAGNEELLARPGVDEVLDHRDRILLPGFIDGHVHLYGMLAHGLLPQKPLADFNQFLRDYWWPDIENRLDPEAIEAAAKMSCIEHIRSGVTTICDVLEAPNAGLGILEREASLVKALGLRGGFSTEASERLGQVKAMELLAENVEFAQAHRHDPQIWGMLSIHTTFTCGPSYIQKAVALAKDHQIDFHMHLSESDYEPELCEEEHGMRPTELYDKLGALGPHIVASQGVSLQEQEIEILRRHNCRLVHIPLSNCEVGGGFAPVPKLLDAGVKVGLGTDGYINDFFEVMRGAFLMHKSVAKNSSIMPAHLVFAMATAIGAEVLGRNDLGKLQPGYCADFIVMDNLFPTQLTAQNFFDQLVVFGRSAYVRDVYVGGKPVMLDRQILHGEENECRQVLQAKSAEFWGNAAKWE